MECKAKKAAAIFLALVLLSACTSPAIEPETVDVGGTAVALVPLDDRPDNVECAAYIAQMNGYKVLLPETDLYATKLNAQPPNGNGTQYGNRAALYEWLIMQEQNGCDRYVICLDQLLSGGLVSSRAMTGTQNITLSDGSTYSEAELLAKLVEALSRDENNRVWLLDTVMRLAPTVGYLDWNASDYDSIRAYASEPRQELENNSLDGVTALYRMGADGTEIPASGFGVSGEKLSAYLEARQRKLSLTDEALNIVSEQNNDIFRVLIGIDDSSEAECIQKNEISYIESCLRENDTLLSGVDDLEFKALSRMYLDDISWEGAEVELRYFGGLEDEAACVYDYRPLSETVTEHLEFFDLHLKTTDALQVLILTKPENESTAEEYCDELISAINENQRKHIPTILIDASDRQYGDFFREKLRKEADIGALIGYAGFLDMAIVTGTALSRGVSRYAGLMQGGVTDAANKAYMKMMTDAVVRDFAYVGEVRDKVSQKVTDSFGGSTANFFEPEIDAEKLTDFMSSQMKKSAAPVIRNLENSEYISSLSDYNTESWGEIELRDFNFPWNRAFEIRMKISIN